MKYMSWMTVFFAGLALAGNPLWADMAAGTGFSNDPDARKAGTAAAAEAKKGIGAAAPALVLVYESYGNKQAVLDGVADVFPKEKIFGCSSYGPIANQGFGKGNTVGVLALAGEALKVTVARADNAAADQKAAGRKIGEALGKPDPTRSILLLFGNCHVPANDVLAKGVQEVLGANFPILGGAAAGGISFFEGSVVPDAVLGIVISMPMKFAVARTSAVQAKDALDGAVKAEQKALAELGAPPKLVLVFECGGRQGAMNLAEEQKMLLQPLPAGAAIFGFYGSGEIGPSTTGAPAEGVGYQAVIGVIAPAP